MNKKRALVTGGCGFIGSCLAKRLVQLGYHVVVIDNLSTGKKENLPNEAEFVYDDIRNYEVISKLLKNSDICFHLAAIASIEKCTSDWLGSHQINLSATIGLFEQSFLLKNPIPIIYASSAAVYGDCDKLPLSENILVKPLTSYGADKLGCEMHAYAAGKIHGLKTLGLRFFDVYGAGQEVSPYAGVIVKFINEALTNQPITMYGNGDHTRDFVYVEDVVDALILGIQHVSADAEIINICSGKEISVNEIAKNILSLIETKSVTEHTEYKSGDIKRSVGNADKASRILNWNAKTDFANGLREVVKNYSSKMKPSLPRP